MGRGIAHASREEQHQGKHPNSNREAGGSEGPLASFPPVRFRGRVLSGIAGRPATTRTAFGAKQSSRRQWRMEEAEHNVAAFVAPSVAVRDV
jgi:hypothetical protein